MPTPHNSALPGDIADTVLMPGDPMRSRYLAENFLENPRLVNNVRSAQGYTGHYKGRPVTVMSSGMGMPSIAIHAHELFDIYGVKSIIRIGTAGGMSPSVRVGDIIIAMAACIDSDYISRRFSLDGTYAPVCDFGLLSEAVSAASALGLEYKVGNILSSDIFYGESKESAERWSKMNVLAVEMETAALYANAAYFGKKALTLLTVSDHLLTGESLSSDMRERGLDRMIRLALETAVKN